MFGHRICHQLVRCVERKHLNPRLLENKSAHSSRTQPIRLIASQRRPIHEAEPIHDEDGPKELATTRPAMLLEKELPNYFSDGKLLKRISHVDFIDEALDKIKELGLQRDLEAYKQILRVLPPGKYHPLSLWDIGLHHAPQQLAAIRLLWQMEIHRVWPDKEIEELVISAFSVRSNVWEKCARSLYWTMKARNIDTNPLPETIPEKTHEVAKVALARMLDDPRALVTVTNTSQLSDSVDKTWLVYSQSPSQKDFISQLKEGSMIRVEDGGLTYVSDKTLSYYVLKYYPDEETVRRKNAKPEPDFDYNSLKVKFFGKPIKEKLEEKFNYHFDGRCYILSIGFTGTSSPDSVLSWVKILERRNPNLKNMNVIFNQDKPTMELADSNEVNSESQQSRGFSN